MTGCKRLSGNSRWTGSTYWKFVRIFSDFYGDIWLTRTAEASKTWSDRKSFPLHIGHPQSRRYSRFVLFNCDSIRRVLILFVYLVPHCRHQYDIFEGLDATQVMEHLEVLYRWPTHSIICDTMREKKARKKNFFFVTVLRDKQTYFLEKANPYLREL